VRRVLVEWRGIKFYSYPVMLYVGTLLGIIAGTYGAALQGLNPGRVYLAMLLLFPSGLVGARLLFLLSHWHIYRRAPRRIWRQSEGGASVYGGLVLSFLFSLPLLKILRVPIGGFWDAASITMLTGMIFTKVGCLLNGCCAGRPTSGPMALYLPDHRGIWCCRLPTQLLEAGWASLILLSLIGLWNRLPFEGAIYLYTVATYSLGRWWLEATREDIESIGSLSLHRAISVVLFVTCLASFLILWPPRP
jgi:phosphatidylglycerol:prolipoprotein diacylglycerol transferase